MKVFNLDKQRIYELKEKAKISYVKLKDEEFIRRGFSKNSCVSEYKTPVYRKY
jgi:hypothetical protein